MPTGVSDLSYAQLQTLWLTLCDGHFEEREWWRFLVALHRDLPEGSLLRLIGAHVLQEWDAEGEGEAERRPLVLEGICDWPMTTRIDGIMPMRIPLADDIGVFPRRLFQHLILLGFDYPSGDQVERLEADLGLCLLAWLHRRRLKSDHGMHIELVTQCPRSALSAKEELAILGTLPNASQITIFYSSLKGSQRLTMDEASVAYVDRLCTRRDADGILRMVGVSLPREDA